MNTLSRQLGAVLLAGAALAAAGCDRRTEPGSGGAPGTSTTGSGQTTPTEAPVRSESVNGGRTGGTSDTGINSSNGQSGSGSPASPMASSPASAASGAGTASAPM